MTRVFKPVMGRIIVDPIVEKAQSGKDLQDLAGHKLSSKMKEHPMRAIVVFVPDEFYVNGRPHPCPLKPGDIVSLTDVPGGSKGPISETLIFDGKMYFSIPYSSMIHGYERPEPKVTEEKKPKTDLN